MLAQLAILAAGWVATALAYPWLRRGINWFVDTVILKRPDYRWLESTVLQQLQNDDSIGAVLERMKHDVGVALSATDTTWRTETTPPPVHPAGR